jgi:hypothetical protein
MPLAQVRRREAVTKSEFHRRLRTWRDTTDDTQIGPVGGRGQTPWVHVRDGSGLFALNADTKRQGVEDYLQLVKLFGDDLQWKVVASRAGKMTALEYGPEGRSIRYFYLYVAGGSQE